MLIQREYITPRYKIITKIGKGGLGEVYEVLDLWDEKRIALKLHSPESEIEKNIEDQFKQEYRLISELSHPGIVKA